MTAVMMIGVDPHKGSHTAVALDTGEVPLDRVRIRAWPGPGRAAAGVGAGLAGPHLGGRGGIGLGYLLAQQLVAAGEWCWTSSPSWPSSTTNSRWAAP
jgi:transposase